MDSHRRSLTSLAVLAALLLAACGSVAQPSGSTGSPSPSPAAAGGPTAHPPLHTPPTIIGPHSLVVTDQDNGHTVSIRRGDRLLVMLASTYWRLDGSSDPGVLRQAAEPTVAPQPSGCVPGGGCGTVSAAFDAVATGSANVSARRTTCGEALSCTGNLGLFRVTVLVSG